MNFPHWRIDNVNAFDENIARAIRLNEVRPQIFTFAEDSILHGNAAFAKIEQFANTGARRSFSTFFAPGPRPPVLIRSGAIERTSARDCDVLLLEGVDERRVVHALCTFETRVNDGQVFLWIGAEFERRTFRDVAIDVDSQITSAGR